MEEVRLSRFEVEAILLSELESAKERYRVACDEFTPIARNIPATIQNRALRLQSAEKERLTALAHLQKSLSRFNSFKVYGVMPGDLIEPSSEKSKTAADGAER